VDRCRHLRRRLERERGQAEADQVGLERTQLVEQQLVLALGERRVAVPDEFLGARGHVDAGVLGHLVAVRLRDGDDEEVLEVDDAGVVAGALQIARELRHSQVEPGEELDQRDASHLRPPTEPAGAPGARDADPYRPWMVPRTSAGSQRTKLFGGLCSGDPSSMAGPRMALAELDGPGARAPR